MDKKFLIKKAMQQLRDDKLMMVIYLHENNYDMYGYKFRVVIDKIHFLRDLGLINFNQWRRLMEIVRKW